MRSKEELIIDYLDGNLTGDELQQFESRLKSDPSLLLELDEIRDMDSAIEDLPVHTPSSELESRFSKMLEEEIAPKKGRLISMSGWKNIGIAASILICGICIGFFNQGDGNTSTINPSQSQVNPTHFNYVSNLLDESSPMKRIKGIHETNKLTNPDIQTIKLLGTTLKNDPSSNVRLAAAKALGNMLEHEEARICLVEALSVEEDPSVKIEIINILSTSRDKRSIDPLNKVIQNENDLKFVKDEAQKGLLLINNAY